MRRSLPWTTCSKTICKYAWAIAGNAVAKPQNARTGVADDDADDDDDHHDDHDYDDDHDDDTDDDNDHKNDSYTAAGAAPGASIII